MGEAPAGGRLRLTEDAVALYKLIVANPGWTDEDAAHLGLDRTRVTAALQALRTNRLLRPSVDPVRIWDPVGPDCALVDLIGNREAQLHQERASLVEIRDDLLSLQPAYFDALRRRAPSNAIDLVSGSGGTLPSLLTLHAQQGSGDVCVASPGFDTTEIQWLYFLRVSPPGGENALTIRLVLDHSTGNRRFVQRQLAALNESGQDVRMVPSVPMRLVLFDGRTAVIPAGDDRNGAGAAVVRHPVVVESLRAAFDLLWQSAVPFQAGPLAPGELRDQVRLDIMRHLAFGHKDEVIARRLGLSVRTCRRHIAEIMEQLGASSRFQAGVLAERQVFRAPAKVSADRDG